MKKYSTILDDHVRVKKKLIPELVAKTNIKGVDYLRQVVPEVIWVRMLIRECGEKEGINTVGCWACALKEYVEDAAYGKQSTFIDLEKTDLDRAFDSLNLKQQRAIEGALRPLAICYPELPIVRALPERELSSTIDESIGTIASCVRDIADNASRDAIITLATSIYASTAGGGLKFFKDCGMKFIEQPDEVIKYPSTDLSRQIASELRSALNAFAMMESDGWSVSKYFWNRGLELTECMND